MSPREKIKKVARSFYLPKRLNELLNEEAARRGYSGNALAIMALESYLGAPAAPAVHEPLPAAGEADDGIADF